MQLMIAFGDAQASDFVVEYGEVQLWYRCGGYDSEWDYTDPLKCVQDAVIYAHAEFPEDVTEPMVCNLKIKNIQHLFKLYRELKNEI